MTDLYGGMLSRRGEGVRGSSAHPVERTDVEVRGRDGDGRGELGSAARHHYDRAVAGGNGGGLQSGVLLMEAGRAGSGGQGQTVEVVGSCGLAELVANRVAAGPQQLAVKGIEHSGCGHDGGQAQVLLEGVADPQLQGHVGGGE